MLKQLKCPGENWSAWCSASDKLQLAEDTLNAVRWEGGLAGPVGVSLSEELRVDGGVRPDLLHHHRPSSVAQSNRPAQLLALLSEVELDICRGRNNMSSFIDCILIKN